VFGLIHKKEGFARGGLAGAFCDRFAVTPPERNRKLEEADMNVLLFRDVERQARRMGEMVERLDVDTLKFVCLRDGESYARARTTCFDCANTAQCLSWLDASPRGAEPPTFCPNFPLFDSCKR
jgi:hypothetical protein